MTTVNRREYGKALSTYGFNYHNVIRYRRDSGIDKVSKRQVDWYMNNLLKRPDISMVWACVEPDYDKYTGQTYSSNHVHFAYVGNKSLSNDQLSNYMRVNRYYLLNTEPVVNGMGYFTKHLGKDLSYHNIYV